MKVVIIIPTYNEAGNIERLISEINTNISSLLHSVHLLIVDDNSPDGTGQRVRNLVERYPNLHLMTGSKGGLGSAYKRGISHALYCLGADTIMEMDADFSHKPTDIARLLEGLRDADFVIGSRYVEGGKIPDNWAYGRKLNSKFGNIFARYIVGLKPIKDCTAGFRAIKASVLKHIKLSAIKTRGYCFQIDLLQRAVVKGAKVLEIPVEFVDRSKGESKLGLKDIFEFLIFVWVIRLENWKTFFKFNIVGIIGIFFNLGLFSVLLKMGFSSYSSSALSIGSLVISNYILNQKWTFSKSNKPDSVEIESLGFNRIFYSSFLFPYITFIILSLICPRVTPHVFQGIGLFISVLVSYFLVSHSNTSKKI